MLSKLTTYLHESRQELLKVLWPGRRELLTQTMLVLGVTIALGAFIGVVDYVFTTGLEQFLRLR